MNTPNKAPTPEAVIAINSLMSFLIYCRLFITCGQVNTVGRLAGTAVVRFWPPAAIANLNLATCYPNSNHPSPKP